MTALGTRRRHFAKPFSPVQLLNKVYALLG